MTKKSKQKFEYLENKNRFQVEKKAFFIVFEGLSVSKSCLRHESAPEAKTSLLFLLCIFVNGMEKEPSTKFCGILVRFHIVIKLHSFELSLSDVITEKCTNYLVEK